jgi:DNA-binding PadR family transcriptional regulator
LGFGGGTPAHAYYNITQQGREFLERLDEDQKEGASADPEGT